MAASVRLKTLLFTLIYLFGTILASPITSTPISATLAPHVTLEPRRAPILNNVTGELQVFDPNTGALIPQGPATDGGGVGSSPAALVWIVFSIVVGVPLALAGLRGWRLTTATGTGLALAVCIWAGFINSASDTGIADLTLTLIVLACFLLGGVIGAFNFGRVAGITCLGISGGVSAGIRIMLFREDLLIPGRDSGMFIANWILIAALGVGGGAVLIWWQRTGIVVGCASAGTFLTALGIDLIINQQSGMSRGLRFLFDRNSSHIADILGGGYKPPVSTIVLMVVSLVLTPLLAYAQHRVFKEPFNRFPDDDAVDLNSLNLGHEHQEKQATRLSVAWANTKTKVSSRFSL
ncbi:hypothetical protein BDN71DRAFT_1449323 [Pleurotus eryngii]|uniref:TM7S3/TM198-like domain-containing protein n=1 Tax=Pleurotus eryngii TaxID=5323 RepID=A0A9P6D641_PLEER|nr:hypothetical protein BDN71DRAFT_1449323 [Pleurotus eryngii]